MAIGEAGGDAITQIADVAVRAEVAELVARSEQHFGGLDVTDANAGVGHDECSNTGQGGTRTAPRRQPQRLLLCRKYAIPARTARRRQHRHHVLGAGEHRVPGCAYWNEGRRRCGGEDAGHGSGQRQDPRQDRAAGTDRHADARPASPAWTTRVPPTSSIECSTPTCSAVSAPSTRSVTPPCFLAGDQSRYVDRHATSSLTAVQCGQRVLTGPYTVARATPRSASRRTGCTSHSDDTKHSDQATCATVPVSALR